MLHRNGYDLPALIGLMFSLLISCAIISAKTYYWNDELYSYYLIADPTFSGMLAAFGDKINNTPIVYFVLGWLWAQVFGASELSLRALSSLTMFVAAVLTWFLIRRNYSAWAATFAVMSVFTLSVLVLEQNAEARMYGLLLALSALVFLQYDQSCKQTRCSTGFALGIAASHALLLHTHLFGIFYSATAIGAGLLVDYARGQWQPRLYVAFMVAWISLLAYLPTFLVQADAGNPRAWIPPPSLGDLVWFYGVQMRLSVQVLIMLVIVYGMLRWFIPGASGTQPRSHADGQLERWAARPTLALAVCLLLLPLAIWLISLAIKPVFISRYMIPILLAVAVLLAHFADRLDTAFGAASSAGGRFATIVASLGRTYRQETSRRVGLLVLLLFPLVYAWQLPRERLPQVTALDFGYDDLPIVFQYSHAFLKGVHYDPDAERYFHLLDWESAVSLASGTFPPQEYKHMRALLRQYPERFAERIVESDEFLATNDRFLVVDDENYDYACTSPNPWYSVQRNTRQARSIHCPQLLEQRILADPRYSVRLLGRVPEAKESYPLVVLLVEREAD